MPTWSCRSGNASLQLIIVGGATDTSNACKSKVKVKILFCIATLSIEAIPRVLIRQCELYHNLYATSTLIWCMPSERYVVSVHIIPQGNPQSKNSRGYTHHQHWH